MSPSDIMVSSIFLGDIRTRLLSGVVCYPFSAHSSSLIWVGVQESWTGHESTVTMPTCVNLWTWRQRQQQCSVLPSFVITCAVRRSPQPLVTQLNFKYTEKLALTATVRNPDHRIWTHYHPWQQVNVAPLSFNLQKKKEKKKLVDKTSLWLVKLQTTDSLSWPKKDFKTRSDQEGL